MAVIDHLDLETKRIYLATGVRSYHPVDDVYKEIRTLRRTNETLRGFDIPVVASGNEAKGGGRFTPRLAKFRLGWKIVPEDVSHVLYISGEQITDTGEGGDACIDLDVLSSTSKVFVHYEPPLAEIIETGISGLTEEESSRLMEIDAVKAKTDVLPPDPASNSGVEAALAAEHDETRESIDEIKHIEGAYEPEKESLEAIRTRLDEAFELTLEAIQGAVKSIAEAMKTIPKGSFRL